MTFLRRVRGFVITMVVTILLVATTAFGFGLESAAAATSIAQLGGQPPIQVATMNRVQAITKDLEGKAQEAIGNMTGDSKNQIMGKAKQAEGQVLKNVEDVRDKAKLKRMTNEVTKGLENARQDMKRK